MSQYDAPNLTVDTPDGTTRAYRRFGAADTVPVVLLQHYRGNLDNWDPDLVNALAARREVIMFDAGGVGLSTGRTPTTVREFARDALVFIDALGITELDLLGFSLGGFVAQEATLLRPSLVRRLILAGTGPQGGRDMHGWSPAIRAHSQKEVQGAEDVLYLFFTSSDTSQARGEEYLQRIFTREQDRDTVPSLAVRDAQIEAIIDWGLPNLSELARLSGIQQPTLVANGNEDMLVPTVNSYLLAGHLPDARLTIYPDAGHGFLFQYPREFAAEVNAFLDAPELSSDDRHAPARLNGHSAAERDPIRA